LSGGRKELTACASCGTPMAARYCPACGEKRIGPADFRIGHFLDDVLETFTHADGKVFLSLRLLLTRPGLLTADYMEGRRRPYLKPLPLFLVANTIFFLGLPLAGFNTLTTPLAVHLQHELYSPIARAMFEHRFPAGRHIPAGFAQEFDAHCALLAKSLVIAMVPALALASAAMLYRRRRPFLQHLVFALHFYAFFLLYLLASLGITMGILRLIVAAGFHPGDLAIDNTISAIGAAILALYLYPAIRRAFGGSPLPAAASAIALTVLVVEILHGYRFLLFLVTYLTVPG
jgi:hypothetical protein